MLVSGFATETTLPNVACPNLYHYLNTWYSEFSQENLNAYDKFIGLCFTLEMDPVSYIFLYIQKVN